MVLDFARRGEFIILLEALSPLTLPLVPSIRVLYLGRGSQMTVGRFVAMIVYIEWHPIRLPPWNHIWHALIHLKQSMIDNTFFEVTTPHSRNPLVIILSRL